MFKPISVNKDYSFSGKEQKGFGIETVHGCNARCVFCCFGHDKEQLVTNIFTGETWAKQHKLMDWKLIESILERHKPHLFILTGQGEPFLDPRIPDILELSEKYDPFNLSIFSNANLMTDKVLDKIIPNKRFKSINFSLNAFTDETRMDVMGIPYKKGEENIMMFLEKRREYEREVEFDWTLPNTNEKQDLRVGISLLAVHGMYKGKLVSNMNEITQFKAYWDKILREYHCNGEVGIFPSGNWGGAIPREILCQDMNYIDPTGCGQWDCTSPTIDVDGQLMLCCYNSRWSFGSCLDDVAMERWLKRREILGVDGGGIFSGKVLHATPFCDKCSHRFVPTHWKIDLMGVACVVLTLNEESRIRECLKHVKSYVDYLLVLDGGSSDKTVEIATEYADRVEFKEPSKMMGIAEDKNYARTLVPKDCGWILWVDADERFDLGFLKNIKENLKSADKQHQVCFRFPRINLPDAKNWPDYQIRLIRNSRDIEFGGEVFPETDEKDSPQDVPFYIPENIPLDQIDREEREERRLGVSTAQGYPILHLPRREDERRAWWK